jgi:hypothetical protein
VPLENRQADAAKNKALEEQDEKDAVALKQL